MRMMQKLRILKRTRRMMVMGMVMMMYMAMRQEVFLESLPCIVAVGYKCAAYGNDGGKTNDYEDALQW